MSEPAVAAQQVRDVLRRLYDLPYLQTHPLARDAGSGKALQRGLIETLELLCSGSDRDGRIHQLLTQTYVEGRPAGEVCRQLGLSRSVYYREHARGIAAVASLLRDRWRTAPPAAPPGTARPDPSSTARSGSMRRPLTSFVGRAAEHVALAQLLGAARLVTLIALPSIRGRLTRRSRRRRS